eukprot:gene7621-biopygen12069
MLGGVARGQYRGFLLIPPPPRMPKEGGVDELPRPRRQSQLPPSADPWTELEGTDALGVSSAVPPTPRYLMALARGGPECVALFGMYPPGSVAAFGT